MEGRAALHDPVRSFILSGVPADGSARRLRLPAARRKRHSPLTTRSGR